MRPATLATSSLSAFQLPRILLLFSKNVGFTNVLTSIANAVPEHPNFKRELRKVSDTHVRYVFRQKNDLDRDLYLAVQAFNIPHAVKG